MWLRKRIRTMKGFAALALVFDLPGIRIEICACQ
jgi:hypothetical protein